jgi:hypothetical protein
MVWLLLIPDPAFPCPHKRKLKGYGGAAASYQISEQALMSANATIDLTECWVGLRLDARGTKQSLDTVKSLALQGARASVLHEAEQLHRSTQHTLPIPFRFDFAFLVMGSLSVP